MHYQIFQLEDTNRPGTAGLVRACRESIADSIKSQGATVYGIFPSLFGLASNSLYLVTSGKQPVKPAQADGIRQVDCWQCLPTVRPTAHTPRSEPGVYVFRWFDIQPGTQDEIVALSSDAWRTFEADFDARIQGLFIEDTGTPSRMLLLTWYRDLSVWEASRAPSPEARENFIRRHQLTRRALPVATMLAGVDGLNLVSSS
jgi:hypothetical protein